MRAHGDGTSRPLPQGSSKRADMSGRGPTAAADQAGPRIRKPHAVGREVLHGPRVTDLASGTLWQPGIGKRRAAPGGCRHLAGYLEHALRSYGAVRAHQRDPPLRQLLRHPVRKAGRDGLAVLDEGLVGEDRNAEPGRRVMGKAQLTQVGEGLEQQSVDLPLDERLRLPFEHRGHLGGGDRPDRRKGMSQGADRPDH